MAASTDPIACRTGAVAAAMVLLGVVLSGPLAVVVIELTRPQPAWANPRIFAEHYHPLQTMPYVAGLLLVGGFVALVASLHAMARAELRGRTTIALVFTAVFATFVFLNYVLQTTFVPALASRDLEANGPLVAALSMVNPRSLGWCLEMWGYGFLGVATWLVAPVLSGDRLERLTAWTLVANGPVSIAPVAAMAAWPGWTMTIPGLAAFVAWNLLVLAMAGLALATFRRRLRVAAEERDR
jgi:hypothetical protein